MKLFAESVTTRLPPPTPLRSTAMSSISTTTGNRSGLEAVSSTKTLDLKRGKSCKTTDLINKQTCLKYLVFMYKYEHKYLGPKNMTSSTST